MYPFKILLVEDEPSIARGLIDTFTYHGFEVQHEKDGSAALERFRKQIYDLVILDVMVPGIDGFEICEKIRIEAPEQAILFLTALNSDDDVVQGLQLGADDYVKKPFSVHELVLRVKALLRRTPQGRVDHHTVMIGTNLSVDTANCEAVFLDSNRTIELTRKEVKILCYLKQHSLRPVPRGELLSHVWEYSRRGRLETRTVDIHIARLRKKIEANPSEPTLLVTVRGEGYQLKEESGAEILA